MKTDLGADEQVCGWTLAGCPSPPELTLILLDIIQVIDMTPYGSPDIRSFPTEDGKGGHGCQIYMPLTESWIIGGTWEKHNRTRVVLSSCEPYDPEIAERRLVAFIGHVTKKGTFNL